MLRGDLEYLFLSLRLACYNSNDPCNCCQANASTIQWTDARRNAAKWLDKIWTSASFAAAFPNRHCIFKLPGVSILNYCPDWLHTKALGTDAWLYGSILFSVCLHVLPGNFKENLETLRRGLPEAYDSLKVKERLPKLSQGMFHRDKGRFACLKGRGSVIKAFGLVLEI